jgi:inhibitor of KinA
MIGYQNFGDAAILLTFGEVYTEKVQLEVRAWAAHLRNANLSYVADLIPAYTTLTVLYKPSEISYEELLGVLKGMKVEPRSVGSERVVKIPVCYDPVFGIDMQHVSAHTGLSTAQIIRLHTEQTYRVSMLGFTPGFFYLAGMDKRLFCPRKEIPRLRIESGAVGIAGEQTGVYSVDSPGGWQLIGKTPVPIFDRHNKDAHFLVNQGDVVQFYSIDLEEFKNYNR